MRNILAIAGRELWSYYSAPGAYILMAVFLIITGYGFAWNPATYLETSIQGFLAWAGFCLMILIPALTMRLLAREAELGTIELLLTAPVSDMEVMLGKFLSSLGILVTLLLLTLFYPFLLFIFGDPDPGPLISGYLGISLLGATFLAIGLFASSLASSQVISFVLANGITLAFWVVGQAAGFVQGLSAEVLKHISLSSHFPDFGRGVVDTRAVIYYISLIVFFLFLTLKSLEIRRWR